MEESSTPCCKLLDSLEEETAEGTASFEDRLLMSRWSSCRCSSNMSLRDLLAPGMLDEALID